eukprot:6496537-Prymnesium_polylepis.2
MRPRLPRKDSVECEIVSAVQLVEPRLARAAGARGVQRRAEIEEEPAVRMNRQLVREDRDEIVLVELPERAPTDAEVARVAQKADERLNRRARHLPARARIDHAVVREHVVRPVELLTRRSKAPAGEGEPMLHVLRLGLEFAAVSPLAA